MLVCASDKLVILIGHNLRRKSGRLPDLTCERISSSRLEKESEAIRSANTIPLSAFAGRGGSRRVRAWARLEIWLTMAVKRAPKALKGKIMVHWATALNKQCEDLFRF